MSQKIRYLSGARRPSSTRRGRRHLLPRRPRLGRRRLPRRGRVLRPQRLPDHDPAAPRVASSSTGTEWNPIGHIDLKAFWTRRARRLLPALLLVLGAVAIYAVVDRRARRAPHDPRRRHRVAVLRRELAVHLERPVLLRAVRGAVAASSLLVARDRGAVLPALAADRRTASCAGGRGSVRALALVRGDRGHRLGRPDGHVMYTPGPRPVTRSTTAPTPGRSSLLIGALLAMLMLRRPIVERPAARWTLHAAAHRRRRRARLLVVDRDRTLRLPLPRRVRRGRAAGRARSSPASRNRSSDRSVGSSPSRRCASSAGSATASTCGTGRCSSRSARPGSRSTATSSSASASPPPSRSRVLSYYAVEMPIRRGALTRIRLRSFRLRPGFVTPVAIAAVARRGGPHDRGRARRPVQVSAAEVKAPKVQAGTPASTDAGVPPPTRVLLVGDSVANSLAPGLQNLAATDYFQLWNASVPGLRARQRPRPALHRRLGEPAAHLRARAGAIAGPPRSREWNPQVAVVLLGAQDTFDRRIDGKVYPVRLSRAAQQLAMAELQQAVDILGKNGAHVVFLTAPYYVLGWPQQIVVNRSHYNPRGSTGGTASCATSAAANPGTVVGARPEQDPRPRRATGPTRSTA